MSFYGSPIIVCMIITVATCTDTAGVVQTTFLANASMTVKDSAGYSESRQTPSAIQCAGMCERNKNCWTFTFDKINKNCSMKSSRTNADKHYWKHAKCPTAKGYTLWVYQDMSLCLKYNAKILSHVDATASCQSDGGHLLLIDGPDVRSRVLLSLPQTVVSGQVWLDGFDEQHDNVFIAWNGQPITWYEWSGSDPQNRPGEDCMSASPNDYKTGDKDCLTDRKSVICQIEVM